MLRVAGFGELDPDCAAIGRIAPADNQTCLLESVEMAGERRPLDVERARELELCGPLSAFEGGQDQPCRRGAADLGEGLAERAPDGLRRAGEL